MLAINQLKAGAIRNLVEFNIKPAKRLNFFYGPNASGKTSVLETIYLLSRVKSFRSKRIHDVITRGEQKLHAYTEGESNGHPFAIGLEKGRGINRLKFNGELIQTASEQAKRFPIYVLTPEHYLLFSGTPKDRRHWLDWSLFHVEQDYLQIWKSYHRALRHRNALLKTDRYFSESEIVGWERMMADEAQKIDTARLNYLGDILALLNQDHLPLVMDGVAQINYRQGDYADGELISLLAETREQDVKKGFTGLGPHRADIVFNYDDFNVAKHLSRGQTKLFGVALITAQISNLRDKGTDAIMLVDDMDAELDSDSTKNMYDLLIKNETQTFISSLTRQEWMKFDSEKDAVFHVKHGAINKMVE